MAQVKTVEISEQSQMKILMHCFKFHTSDVYGLLLGKQESGTVSVTEVVPLFHDRMMQGPMELALDMVASNYADLQIVGLYEALAGHVNKPDDDEDSSSTPKK